MNHQPDSLSRMSTRSSRVSVTMDFAYDIVLQPTNRRDTVPGVVTVADDGYIPFSGAFSAWTTFVPTYLRGPEDVLSELAEDVGSFAYERGNASFHPSLLRPLLHQLGAATPPGTHDPNEAAADFADLCAADIDARIEDFVGGAFETAAALKTATWGTITNAAPRGTKGRAQGLVDPDRLMEALGTTYGAMLEDPDGRELASQYPVPDESTAKRTVSRELAAGMFVWARKRAATKIAERLATGAIVPLGGVSHNNVAIYGPNRQGELTDSVNTDAPASIHALMSSILVDEEGRPLLHVRNDGMVYVSAMCTQGGVRFKDWADYKGKLIEALAHARGLDPSTLIQQGQSPFNPRARGTYLYPELVVDLAGRISVEFKLACMDVMNRYLTGRVTSDESAAAAAALASAMVGGPEPIGLAAMRDHATALQTSGDHARRELARLHEVVQERDREIVRVEERLVDVRRSGLEAARAHKEILASTEDRCYRLSMTNEDLQRDLREARMQIRVLGTKVAEQTREISAMREACRQASRAISAYVDSEVEDV